MSEFEAEKSPASTSHDRSAWKYKLSHIAWPKVTMPHWYWPWWVIAAIVVATLMGASYFAGMLSTISHAHTLLSSLHTQLQQVAQQKAQLDKQAKALGVLSSLQSGHWSSPAVWAVFLPVWLWFLAGVAVGIGALAAIGHWRSSHRHAAPLVPATYRAPAYVPPAAPLPSYEQYPPQRHKNPPPGPKNWLREFVGLVIWIAVISSIVFVVVHAGLVSGQLPKLLSLPGSLHLSVPSWLHP